MAKVIDDAPVLILTFVVYQTIAVRDKLGKVVEGSEVGLRAARAPVTHAAAQDDVQQAVYVLALRRDPANFDPKQAWEVMELGMQFSNSSW